MLDFHNHLMPGVDDGAANINESREGLIAFRGERVADIITTPHLRASMIDRRDEFEPFMDALETAWSALTLLATEEFPEMSVERGAEICGGLARRIPCEGRASGTGEVPRRLGRRLGRRGARKVERQLVGVSVG